MLTVNLSDEGRWKKYDNTSPLISLFKRFHPLNEEIEQRINQYTFPVTFKKK